MTDDAGVVGHAELDIEGSTIFLSTPEDYVGSRAHRERCEIERGMHDNPWVVDGLFVEVENVAAHHALAVEAGATVIRAPEEPGIGYRIYTVEDLEGHRWMFGERLAASPLAAALRWAREWEQAWRAHDVDAVRALYAERAVFHSHPFRAAQDAGDYAA